MAKSQPITIDDLWAMARAGSPSLSPDGAQAVCSATQFDMAANTSSSSLWVLSALGGRPRRLTQCGDKDGQPQFAPDGHRVGFVAKREQQGKKDEAPQFYVIAADGGEAERIGQVPTGVDAFRWCPDGHHLLLVSWVFPEARGEKGQAKAMTAWRERKHTGIATSEGFYRFWDHMLPEGRVPHLLLMDTRSGKWKDLFEGTAYELGRADPDAHCFDVSPDGKRVVFAYDPAHEKRSDGRFALAELRLKSGRIETLAHDVAWDFGAPRYSPDGRRVAFIASHAGLRHTMPGQLAVVTPGEPFEVVSAEWDHGVQAPLVWEDDGDGVLLCAEQRGQRHLWRFDLPDRRAEVVVPGGWVEGFDKAAGLVVTLTSSATHPARLHAHAPGAPVRRIDDFNDALLARLDFGQVEAIDITGAQGDPVQVWLTYPSGFNPRKKHPLLHVIHGGPHTAAGDQWHYRWNTALMAAQGYVVAQVNYHGSTSYGYTFLDSITTRWGALELEDLEAATTALLQQPWADAKRVFASGGSYGGYLVAWMNGHVPGGPDGRYAAYICHAGCYDWQAMFADDAWPWHAKDLGGWYWDDPARVAAQSPIAFAHQMTTPTLVIHGALDYRVPDAQGLAYYNTLKARGVDSRLLWFPDENHWVLKPRNSQLWYREFFDFLARHDPAAKGQKKARNTVKRR
jgi:dipeptidyl aminopeptidase/acylaminoacyl peptidase